MTNYPQITVKELRDQLAALGPAWDNAEVKCWLPDQQHTRRALCIAIGSLIPHAGTTLGAPPQLLIEGNVEEWGTRAPLRLPLDMAGEIDR